MSTLLVSSDRASILSRLTQLQPTTQPQWGTFTAHRMLCHLGDQLRVAVGDLSTQRTDTWASRTLIKWLVVHTPMRPPPGKIMTAPEMLTSGPGDWDTDLAHVERRIQVVGSGAADAVHPYFGPLTPGDWGRLCWKHLDHHLRQFGC